MNLVGLHALIVDDNTSSREILQQHLKSWGVEVVAAETGAAGLAALGAAGARFDFGLLDDQMPGMGGIELARLARQDARWSDLPLILQSSRDDRDGGSEASRLFAAILTKPLRRAQLFSCVSRVMTLRPGTAADAPVSRPAPAAAGPSVGPRILLVEDNAVNREVAVGMLES
ncbi:MAG: response regulator, partial [Steroidobacteraceae bacterium]